VSKIIMDRFPCNLVAVPAGFTDDVTSLSSQPPTKDTKYLDVTRVIVTDETIMVAKDGPQGPQVVFRETYTTFEPSKDAGEDSYVVTTSGKMLAFRKDRGCGCGSRLRGWNPYKTLNSIKDE